MKKIVIAFGVDGTLIQNGATNFWDMKPNWRIVCLLKALASFKNVTIVVWSGGGQDWASEAVSKLDLHKLVKKTYDKNLINCEKAGCKVEGCKIYHFDPPIKPDIAIDDIQACDLGLLNLIVKEK